nr:MAG TPA: hypothetical protein [Caudoviricetes sp.]
MNKAELQELIQDLKDRQEELQQLQLSNPDAFTAEQKAEFDKNAEDLKAAETRLAVVEEALKQNTLSASADNKSGKVVAMVAFGDRFSKRTGKEVNPPQKRYFSFGEWQVFKQNYKLLGYSITDIINDPFGGAADLIEAPED